MPAGLVGGSSTEAAGDAEDPFAGRDDAASVASLSSSPSGEGAGEVGFCRNDFMRSPEE
jgi:hypothetical protein